MVKEINLKNLENVPKHVPVSTTDFESLYDFIQRANKILVVTGAGISTESGIPDYRSEDVGLYSRRANYKPIQQQEFVSNESARKRYWLKNFIGWPTFSIKSPNATHFALTELEKAGKLKCIVTQNVDNLHFKAGSVNVVELHGSAHRIKCLKCENQIKRHDFQTILDALNPLHKTDSFVMNPDGDVDIDEELVDEFTIPDCNHCGGLLQPDIVFFGGSVPTVKVDYVNKCATNCDSLLVLGSTLTVFSSYRIILKASEHHKPIAIVNIGSTRGDAIASLKLNVRCGEILPNVCQKLLNL